jgi:periplasmic copper chaperone A
MKMPVTMKTTTPFLSSIALLLSFSALAVAQTAVEDPWVRSTVPVQRATGAYMKLKSESGAKLVGVKTKAAKVAEIHEMSMKGDVMEMREIKSLELPPGKWVELKPGGMHLMLMELAKPIAKGDEVRMTLILEDKAGKRSELEVAATARSR